MYSNKSYFIFGIGAGNIWVIMKLEHILGLLKNEKGIKNYWPYLCSLRCTHGKYPTDTCIIIFFIKKLLSCCLIEIDGYIQQPKNGADIPYFHIAHFSLYSVNEKYVLILSEYFMPKSSPDSATDFMTPIVAWYSYEQT